MLTGIEAATGQRSATSGTSELAILLVVLEAFVDRHQIQQRLAPFSLEPGPQSIRLSLAGEASDLRRAAIRPALLDEVDHERLRRAAISVAHQHRLPGVERARPARLVDRCARRVPAIS